MLKPTPIAWIAWDAPERIEGHPAIKDGLGQDEPSLMFTIFANGSFKVSATRRPRMHLSESARFARATNTWIDGALVSVPERNLGKVAETLRKRLQLSGCRNLGNGVFEGLDIREALAMLAQIRDIAEPPEPPEKEPVIPDFLKRKENFMPETTSAIVPQPVVDGLVPVFTARIGGIARQACDARTLHAFLESKYQFQDWIKARIKKYEFIENQDFALVSENSEIKTG
jgi:hypothetical protein